MDKWEYKDFYYGGKDGGTAKLNELGKQGWEVVCSTQTSYGSFDTLLLKRRLPS